MSTGLTFGTISALFGLNAGYNNQVQYSVLVGVVIASAVIPTFHCSDDGTSQSLTKMSFDRKYLSLIG